MSSGDKHLLVGSLCIILLLGAILLGGLEGHRKSEKREAAAFSAFVKTTGNEYGLTCEEWRASR